MNEHIYTHIVIARHDSRIFVIMSWELVPVEAWYISWCSRNYILPRQEDLHSLIRGQEVKSRQDKGLSWNLDFIRANLLDNHGVLRVLEVIKQQE